VETGFHGTAVDRIDNIKMQGLIIPKTRTITFIICVPFKYLTCIYSAAEIVNGSALGRGIYIAKSPAYSQRYVRGGNQMLVVAVLTGGLSLVTPRFERTFIRFLNRR
jgi:hypothetical protein